MLRLQLQTTTQSLQQEKDRSFPKHRLPALEISNELKINLPIDVTIPWYSRGQRGITPGAAQARAVADLLIALGGHGPQRAADARRAILPLDALPKQPEHLTT